jgi:hypothetical protein
MVLFKSGALFPSRYAASATDNLNAISRLVLLLTVLIYVLGKPSVKVLAAGALTLAAVAFLHAVRLSPSNSSELLREGFAGYNSQDLYSLVKSNFTEPSVPNPVMNVLLTEIDDNPNRKMAAPAYHPEVEKDLNKRTKEMVAQNFNDPTIDQRLFKDLGDNFTFDQSMRQFYATASTTVPNDQEGFAEYCYGDMISCRDMSDSSGLACLRNMPPQYINPS